MEGREYGTENKRLSIIVPVYNVERYLEECVNSLLSQTYSNIEIILVNDGSTDNCGEICDLLSQKHANINAIHQKNAGLPFARNAGFALASGEYFAFVDPDDAILEDMYSVLIDRLEKDNSDMAVCNFQLFNKTGTVTVSQRYKNGILSPESDAVSYYDCALDSSCNRVYKAEIIRNNNLLFEDKQKVAQEDFWFNLRYFCYASKVSTVIDPFYKYRQRASSITRGHTDNDITNRCCNFVALADKFLADFKVDSRAFMESMTVNMLFSSINNLTFPTVQKIKNIVIKFQNTPYFKSAVSNVPPQSGGIRGYYDKFLKFALRHGWYGVFALLECMRVKRLNSKKRSEDYFA